MRGAILIMQAHTQVADLLTVAMVTGKETAPYP